MQREQERVVSGEHGGEAPEREPEARVRVERERDPPLRVELAVVAQRAAHVQHRAVRDLRARRCTLLYVYYIGIDRIGSDRIE